MTWRLWPGVWVGIALSSAFLFLWCLQLGSPPVLARQVADPHPLGPATSTERQVVFCFVFQYFQKNLGAEYFGIIGWSLSPGERNCLLARCGSHICPHSQSRRGDLCEADGRWRGPPPCETWNGLCPKVNSKCTSRRENGKEAAMKVHCSRAHWIRTLGRWGQCEQNHKSLTLYHQHEWKPSTLRGAGLARD